MIKYFIKKSWIIFVVFVLSVIYILFKLNQNLPSEPSPTPFDKNTESTFSNISPGETTEEDLLIKLGNPSNTEELETYKKLLYPSEIENYPSEVYISNNIVGLIIEPLPSDSRIKLDYYYGLYGTPNLEVVDNNLGPAYPGYVFTDDGIIVFAHNKTRRAIEVWHIPENNIDSIVTQFNKNITEDYLSEPDVIISNPEQTPNP